MKNEKVKRMVGVALLAAIVVVLQLMGSFIRLGPVSVTLVLIPIVVGSAVYGPTAGAFLGCVFSLVVLFQPDTAFFYGVSVFGTVLTVLAKGTLAGYTAGLVHRALVEKNLTVSVILPAVVCPIVNTGIFALGCRLFFWDALTQLGNGNAAYYLFVYMIGFNFIAELAANIMCAPAIIRILKISKKF